RVVGVQRAHRSVVTSVHRLQHVERLRAPTLTDDDAIGSHTQAVAHKVANRDRAAALDVLRLRLEADDVYLAKATLGRILARDEALGGGNESRQNVEKRGLARACAAGDDDV